MISYKPLNFQKKAINDLTEAFLHLWKKSDRQFPIVFQSPTGSGKTFTVAHFIRGLNHLPQWNEDKAFIWVTFSDDLAMQSRDKFFLKNFYFFKFFKNFSIFRSAHLIK
jgi:type III restriction enzyme